ncbi:hypothetical protein [Polaribacter sp. Z022]|uniref:hypothetical protein n=1 Tax=Polaribacter sp. Z022 TaxID=2927125 RepID=UPI00202194B4|nr:hypothetical protein [Polaribacter sp. Z022]MCL7752427.1 hypothetical protein [Polaribacter sp. Z022]
MDNETLIKYLEFLKTECLRHSNDKSVKENELQLFKLEIEKFKKILSKSELDTEIKEKVNSINLDLSLPNFKGFNLIAYIVGDHWNNDRNMEEIMSKRLLEISEEIENTVFEIKTIL